MNAECQTGLIINCQTLNSKTIFPLESWRSLRESNPSFQIENLTS